MADVYPGATYRPVAYHGLRPRQPYKAALLHTNGGGSQLLGYWQSVAAKGSAIGAQYQVFADGRAECYVDPAMVVYHAFGASTWAIGIETEDDGDPKTPWTPAQVKTIAAILNYHDIPAKRLTSSSPGNGVGYHQQFAAWNQSNHGCPGPVRVSQLEDVFAAMTNTTPTPEDDMLKNDPDLQAAIKQLNDRMDARDRSLTWLQDTAKQQAGALGVLTSSASQLQQTINGLSLPGGVTAEALAKALLEQLAAK